MCFNLMHETFEPEAVECLIYIEEYRAPIFFVNFLDSSIFFFEDKLMGWDNIVCFHKERRHTSNTLGRHDNKFIGL